MAEYRVVQALLDKGAEVNAKDKYGLIPASMFAAKSGRTKIVNLLKRSWLK